MLAAFSAVIFGLVILVWSADKFVEGSAATAQHFHIPPLLIGMVVIGFGTSAPEIAVSSLAALQGNPGLALGNAYGSNIANIGLILGLTALISPIAVHSQVLRKELPLLTFVTALAAFQVWDGEVSRVDALVLMAVFAILMGWTIREGLKSRNDAMAQEMQQELKEHSMPLKTALVWLIVGLILLVISSRILVWGAVGLAQAFGVSDLIIGLSIVAIGTSLPELASAFAAIRKNEHDIALGNVLGSNLFNTLAVVGVAGIISPISAEPQVLSRDIAAVAILTVSLFIICYGFKGRTGVINRFEGTALLLFYIGYIGLLAKEIIG